MTISSTNRIAGPFIGAGTTATFPFTFKVFSAADLEVVRVLVSTGAETPLTLTTDYTVSLNGNQNTNPGGSITLVAGNLATGYNLVITSNVANTQPTDLTNQGGFYPEVINDALDRATIQIQQLNDTALNAVHAPVTDGALLMELPAAGIRANKYLAFDASGLPLVADGTSTPAVTSGGDLTFTVNDAGAGVAQDFIFVNDTTEVMRFKGATTRLGIGTAAPTTALDVVGAGTFSGNLTVDTNTLFVNAANNRVGILNATPAVALDVTGAAAISGNLTVDTTTLVVDSANNRVGVGVSPTSTYQLHVKSQGTGSGAFAAVFQNSTPATLFYVRDDGRLSTGTAAESPYNLNTGSAANLFVDSNGIVYRSTSGAKYKTDVQNMAHGLNEVLALRPVMFKGVNDGDKVFGGFIAEEVAAAGLEEYVVRDQAGNPDALAYANMVALLTKAIQQLHTRIAALEAAP